MLIEEVVSLEPNGYDDRAAEAREEFGKKLRAKSDGGRWTKFAFVIKENASPGYRLGVYRWNG